MHDYESEMMYLAQNRKAIHDEIRHQHLANKIHRAKRLNNPKSNWAWLYRLRHLYRLRIHISFDLEEPNPKPKTTG